jgi:hypothetical protein
MRVPRLALPATLAAAALALATFATPAFADDTATTTISTLPGEVTFTSAAAGTLVVGYTCVPTDDGASLTVALTQPGTDGGQPGAAEGASLATCDGSPQAAEVALALTAGDGITAGAASVRARLATADVSADVAVVRSDVVEPSPSPSPSPTPTTPPVPEPTPTPDPTPTQPPAPVKASVSLTTNASPESVVKGKKITVKGTVKKNGKKFKAKTRLEFAPDTTGSYKKVKSVTSSKSGKLSTTLKATTSGAFRFVYAGSSTTKVATSAGDHIVVKPKPKPKPKPKAYSDCKALNKVYPHGVGKSGAHDKKKSGSPVTDFIRDNKTYAKNTKRDGDKDGIACEK